MIKCVLLVGSDGSAKESGADEQDQVSHHD